MDMEDALSGGSNDSDFESDGALAHRRSSILGVLSHKLPLQSGSDGEAELLLEDFRKQAVGLLDQLCVTCGGDSEDANESGGGGCGGDGGGLARPADGGDRHSSASWMGVVSVGRLRLEAFQTAALAYLEPISGDTATAAAEKAAGAFDEAMAYLDEEVAQTGVDAVDTDREALKEVAANIMIALGRLHASRQAATEHREADATAADSGPASASRRGSSCGGTPFALTPVGTVTPAVTAEDGIDTEYEDMVDADDDLSDEDSADFVDARSEPYEDDISSGLAAAVQGDRAEILSPLRRTTAKPTVGDAALSPFGGTSSAALAEAAAARQVEVLKPEGVKVALANSPPQAVKTDTPPLVEAAGGDGSSPSRSPHPTNVVSGNNSGGDAVARGGADTTHRMTEELLNDAFGSDASDPEGGPLSGPLSADEVVRPVSGDVTDVSAEVTSPAPAAEAPETSANEAPPASAETAPQSFSEPLAPLSSADEVMTPQSTRELLDALAQESAGLERLLRDVSTEDSPASMTDQSTSAELASSAHPMAGTSPRWPDAIERGSTSAPSPHTPVKSPGAVQQPIVTFCAARMAKAAAETDAFLDKALGDDNDDDAFDDAGVDSSDDDQAPPVTKNTAGMLAAAAEADAFLQTALDDDSGVHVDDTGVDSEADEEETVTSSVERRAETSPVAAGVASKSPQLAPRSVSPAMGGREPTAVAGQKCAPLETFCAARMEQAATETDAFLDKALGDDNDDDAFDDTGVDSDDDQAPPTALDDDSGVHVDDTGVDSEADEEETVTSSVERRAETSPVAAGVASKSPQLAPRSVSPAMGGREPTAVAGQKCAPLETFCAARMEQAATETDAFLDKALGDDNDDDAFDDTGVDSDDDQVPPVTKNTAGMLAAAAEADAFLQTALDDDSGVHVDDTGVDSDAEETDPAVPAAMNAQSSRTSVDALAAPSIESASTEAHASDDVQATAETQSSPPAVATAEADAVGEAISHPTDMKARAPVEMPAAGAETDVVAETAPDDDRVARVGEARMKSERGAESTRLSANSRESGSSATCTSSSRGLSPPGGTDSSGPASVAGDRLPSSSSPVSGPQSSSPQRFGLTSFSTSSVSTSRSPVMRDTAAEEAEEVAAVAAAAKAYLDQALRKDGEDVDDTGVDSDSGDSQASGDEARERSMAAAAAEADAFLAQALGDDDGADVDDTGVDSDAEPSEEVRSETEERSMAAAAAEAHAFLEMALGDGDGDNVDDTGVNSDAEQEPTSTADHGMAAAAAEANAFLEKALGDDDAEDVDDTGVNSDTEPAADAAGSDSRALASSPDKMHAEASGASGARVPSALNKLRGFAHSLAGNASSALGNIAVAGAVAGGVDIDAAKKKLSDLDDLLGVGGNDEDDDGFEDFETASSEEGAEQWGEASGGHQVGGGSVLGSRTSERSPVPSDASSSPLFGAQDSPKLPVSMHSYGARRFGGGPGNKSSDMLPATVTMTVWPPGGGACQEHSNVPLSGKMLQFLATGAIVELTPRHVSVDAIFMGLGANGDNNHGPRDGGSGMSGGKDSELLGVLAGVTRGHIERLLHERNETAALLEAMINEHCKTAEQVGHLRMQVDGIVAAEKQGREPLPDHCGFSVPAELAALHDAIAVVRERLSTMSTTASDSQVLMAEREESAAAASAATVAELQAAQEASAARIAELEAAAAEASQTPPSDIEETRQALEQAEATIDRLTADLNRASNQRNAMRLQCRQTQAALDRMMASNNQERSKMQSRLLKLQRIADTAQYEVDRAVRGVQHTADEAVAAKSSAESELQTLLVTHGTMCRNFVELEEELLQLRKDHSALRQAHETATAVARMNGENAKITTSRAELVAAEASENAHKLAVQLHEARREAAAARAEAEAASSSRASGSDAPHDVDAAQVTRLQANAESLQTSLTAALQVSDKYKEQLRNLQDRVDESERNALHARTEADLANGRLAGENVVTKDQVATAALTQELAMLKKQHQQRVLELESLLCAAETALSTSASKRLTESRAVSMVAPAGPEGVRRSAVSRLGDRLGEEPIFSGFGRDRSSSPAHAASTAVDGDVHPRAALASAGSSMGSLPDVDVESEDGDRSFGGVSGNSSFRSDKSQLAKVPPPISRGGGSSGMAFSPVSAAVVLPSLWRSQSVNVDLIANDVVPSPKAGAGVFHQRRASIYSPEEVSPVMSPGSPESSPTTATASKPPPAAATAPPKGGRMFKRLGYKLRFNSHNHNN
ncbi:hypothetical protein MMPV_007242 [Pyropia vietnamensis]